MNATEEAYDKKMLSPNISEGTRIGAVSHNRVVEADDHELQKLAPIVLGFTKLSITGLTLKSTRPYVESCSRRATVEFDIASFDGVAMIWDNVQSL